MNIALLGYLHGFGGAEKSIVLLANELYKRGHKVSLLSFSSDNKIYQLNNKIDYFYIPDKGNKKFDILKFRYKNLFKFMKQIQPDIVISFWFQLAVFAMIVSKIQRFKVIYSERGDPSDIEYDGLNGVIRMCSFPLIDGFVFQTKGAQSFFNRYIIKKSCVIHNAISIPKEILVEDIPKEKIIVSVGRLHRQKNFPLLIKAFKDVLEIHPEYKLVIYGEGELRERLERLIDDFDIPNKVLLYGNTKDILRKIKSGELFVLSSDFEGMPNVLMEAMGLGMPCISTDCTPGGASELINNMENGLLVPIGNQKMLVDAMIYMIDNPQKAKAMGEMATMILRTHSLQKIYDKWDSFIEGIHNDTKERIL